MTHPITMHDEIDALPPYVECEQYCDGIRYDRDSVNLEAALARLALLRKWVVDSNHVHGCPWQHTVHRSDILNLNPPCTCGRDALLAATESPK